LSKEIRGFFKWFDTCLCMDQRNILFARRKAEYKFVLC
jgi:hypothetical protein